MAKQEKQQKKKGMFTQEQIDGARAAVEKEVERKRTVKAATDAKGEYEQAQALAYIEDWKKQREAAYQQQMKAAGDKSWEYSEKVREKAAKNDYQYMAALEAEKKLKSGEMSDATVLTYAKHNVKKRQDAEDKTNRSQARMDAALYVAKAEGYSADADTIGIIEKELFGVEYTRVGPAGVATTDPKVAKHWGLNLKQGSFGGTDADFPTGYVRGVLNEYGNNYFKIFTLYPGFKDYLVADGVMTELPPISMSTEWGNSPAASIGEELDKALNNEFLEFCAMKTTDAQTPIMRRKDALTARCYVDSSEVSFQIKFRCYPGQQVGTRKLTTAKEWMLLLGMTTPINAACSFNVDNAIGTVVKAADGIAAAFKELKDSLSDTGGQGKNPQEKADSDMMVQRAEGILAGQDTALESFQNTAARISNPNVFGACLFGVRIYPFIFKAPLTCYISSWSVTPSREWNDSVNDHYYYDFVLNCSMDQKPAAKTWWNDILKES